MRATWRALCIHRRLSSGRNAALESKRVFTRALLSFSVVLVVLIVLTSFMTTTSIASNGRRPLDIAAVDHFAFPDGTDIGFGGDLVVAGATGAGPVGGIHLFRTGKSGDLEHLSFGNCPGYDSDVGIYRNFAIQSVDVRSSNVGCPHADKEGLRIWDVRNPSRPIPAGFAETVHGSHTFTVVANTGFIYVSSYSLTSPHAVDGISIVDLRRDPTNPKVRFVEFPGPDASGTHAELENDSGAVPSSPGCHDIGVDMQRQLAFCAGITETQIWDIRNPAKPVIISIIQNPLINVHHNAAANGGGDILIIGDEYTGAATGIACSAPNNPNGALWFYDISEPSTPRVLSWWAPPDVNPTLSQCTSHVYGSHQKKDWLVAGWFSAGLFVIDFSEPTSPEMLARYDPSGTNFWSAYFHEGYIYANSYSGGDSGGLHVLKLTRKRDRES